jgi:hypothetical protein
MASLDLAGRVALSLQLLPDVRDRRVLARLCELKRPLQSRCAPIVHPLHQFRSEVGVAPLSWPSSPASSALLYSSHLMKSCINTVQKSVNTLRLFAQPIFCALLEFTIGAGPQYFGPRAARLRGRLHGRVSRPALRCLSPGTRTRPRRMRAHGTCPRRDGVATAGL